MKKSMFFFVMCVLFVGCGSDDVVEEDAEIAIDNTLETCNDGILNQDEEGIDCGGVCEACVAQELSFSAGRYRGIWNSSATNGANFNDLNVTAIINNGEAEGSFTGSLFISGNFTSCCGAQGDNGDGAIAINISEGQVTFLWDDVIPGCEGTFNGVGTLVENDRITLNLTGTDCDGDHTGTLEFFK